MRERFNRQSWKDCVSEMAPRVRISSPPPEIFIDMNIFLQKDVNGEWNTIPPIPSEKINSVNCHRFVLYALERISWDEMVSDPLVQKSRGEDFTFGEKIRFISDIPCTLINDQESLGVLAKKSCEIGKTYVGQILDTQTKEMARSFIVTREDEKNYICFDKPGFKYSFTVSDLNTILNFVNKDNEQPYKNQKWRFVSI